MQKTWKIKNDDGRNLSQDCFGPKTGLLNFRYSMRNGERMSVLEQNFTSAGCRIDVKKNSSVVETKARVISAIHLGHMLEVGGGADGVAGVVRGAACDFGLRHDGRARGDSRPSQQCLPTKMSEVNINGCRKQICPYNVQHFFKKTYGNILGVSFITANLYCICLSAFFMFA